MEDDYQFGKRIEYVKKQPVWVFILLSFFTFGFYTIYWFYKCWRFFRESYKWDIYPVWRALFAIFFVHSLLEYINDVAIEKGHPGISSNSYATGYVLLTIIQRFAERILPNHLALIPVLLVSFLFLIPTVKQLNYIYEQDYPGEYLPPFSAGEIVLILFGGIIFVLGVAGTLMSDA